jgi:hypothetical protein
MHKTVNHNNGDKTPIGPLARNAVRQRAEPAPVTAGKHVSKRAQPAPRQVRPRTSEDIANAQTAEQLALRILAAIVERYETADVAL